MSLSLREYLKRHKRTLAAIAKAAQVDRGDISRIADGKRGCSFETAAKIERATDGLVTPNDLWKVRKEWLRQNEGRQSAKAAAKDSDDDEERSPALEVVQ